MLTIRRRLRDLRIERGAIKANIYSLTREGTRIDHHPVIHPNGAVTCTCEDYRFRRRQEHPTVFSPQSWCKHIRREAIAALRKWRDDAPLELQGLTKSV